MTKNKEVTVETFAGNLVRSNAKIKKERAIRISKKANIEFKALIDAHTIKIMNFEDELESMADISTSNVTTDGNRISGVNFDAKAFVTKRANLRNRIAVLKEELAVLKEDEAFYTL